MEKSKNVTIRLFADKKPVAEIDVTDLKAGDEETRKHYVKFAKIFINPLINGSEIIYQK